MSDLNPHGAEIELNGEKHHWLFTLNSIDQIQSRYETDMITALSRLGDKRTQPDTMKYIVKVLIDDEIRTAKFLKKDVTLTTYTEEEIGMLINVDNMQEIATAILMAYRISIPEDDEEADPNQESEQH